jgi:hypothetical protein
MKNAAPQLTPGGYSNWKTVVIKAGMTKIFWYRRKAIAA